MSDTPESNVELGDEFRRLGENLAGSLKSIWEHPETKEIQGEIKQGLHQLGDTINQLADDFSESPTGKRLQAEADDFGERLRSGEVKSKVHEELIRALNTINSELEKARQRWSETSDQEGE